MKLMREKKISCSCFVFKVKALSFLSRIHILRFNAHGEISENDWLPLARDFTN